MELLGGIKLLKVLMEFRKGVLFVRLYGSLNNDTTDIFENEVKEVIIKSGIRYVVLNVSNLSEIKESGIKEIKNLRKILNYITQIKGYPVRDNLF